MKVYELAKELKIQNNKDLIDFLKSKGFKVSSHNQNLTDEMIDTARAEFVLKTEDDVEKDTTEKISEKKENTEKKIVEEPAKKTFALDDMIPCRSVTPWELIEVGSDKTTVYHWSGFGDVDYISYKDLQMLRRKDLIKAPKVIIEDADLCYQWRRELGDTYKYFLNVEYPEEFFDLSDEKFKELLTTAPQVVKEVIKFTAMNMVRNSNYPTVQKLSIIDELLGTCLKDFL